MGEYEKALLYLSDAIEQPDYIIADKHIDTGLVVKFIKRNNTHIQVVIRLCTTEDVAGYKNSVISCWEISNQRLQNYLRNKEIIYKRL